MEPIRCRSIIQIKFPSSRVDSIKRESNEFRYVFAFIFKIYRTIDSIVLVIQVNIMFEIIYEQKKSSVSGNWTPVSRVTGGDTHHYTNTDSGDFACL